MGKPEEFDLLKEIDRLRYYIRLQLNPDGDHDKKIEALIEQIPDLTDEKQIEKLKLKTNELIGVSQKLLKEEWEKFKEESKRGDLKEKQDCFDPILRKLNDMCLARTLRWIN